MSQTKDLQVFGNTDHFEHVQKMAKALLTSDMVPMQYRGSNNLCNCMIAIEMANRIGATVLSVMQNLYVVYGVPSWSSKFIISVINQSKKFKGILNFYTTGEGDNRTCIAHIKDNDDKIIKGSPVSMRMAKLEGWYDKKGSKWKTMPDLMLKYRAASFFGKLYLPDELMGLQSQEELYDMSDDRRVVNGDAVEILKDKLRTQDNPEQAF